MNLRCPLVVLLTLSAQATLTASSLGFGSNDDISVYSETTSGTAGSWTQIFATGTNGTTEHIDCVVADADTSDVCGNPGPSSAVSVSIPEAPGGTLPGGITNYLMTDGDPRYGSPVEANLTGLTVGDSYNVSFYQSSNEESGNDTASNDTFTFYLINGSSTGTYTPPGGDLAYTAPTMVNTGGVSTSWESESFSFVASATTETLEVLANATASTVPPLFNLADVTYGATGTPEPETWALTLLGFGAVFGARKLRRRSSTRG